LTDRMEMTPEEVKELEKSVKLVQCVLVKVS